MVGVTRFFRIVVAMVIAIKGWGGDFVVVGLAFRGLPAIFTTYTQLATLGGFCGVALWEGLWSCGGVTAFFSRVMVVVFFGLVRRSLLVFVFGRGRTVFALLFLGLVRRTLGPLLLFGLFLFFTASLMFFLASSACPIFAFSSFFTVILFFAILPVFGTLFLVSTTFLPAVATLFPHIDIFFLSFAIFLSPFSVFFHVFTILPA